MKNTSFKPATFFLVALMSLAQLNAASTNSFENKVKEFTNDAKESLNKGIDKLGDDFEAVQNYLENYSWKGIIQDKASSGVVTLKHLHLNGHSKAVVVKPGENIEGIVHCHLDKEKCSTFGLYRIVLGINGEGPQKIIGNELGIVAGKSNEEFSLTAPSKPGVYQLRFRVVNSYCKGKALDAWTDEKGNEPDASTTIGIIVVKS